MQNGKAILPRQDALRLAQLLKKLLNSFSVAKVEALGARPHAVGGMEDHLLLVVSVAPRIALSDFVGQVKGTSSHFVNHVLVSPYHFGWQQGYGVVSFGEKGLETVRAYVENLQKHHGEAVSIPFLERTQSEDDIFS